MLFSYNSFLSTKHSRKTSNNWNLIIWASNNWNIIILASNNFGISVPRGGKKVEKCNLHLHLGIQIPQAASAVLLPQYFISKSHSTPVMAKELLSLQGLSLLTCKVQLMTLFNTFSLHQHSANARMC